MGKVIKGRFKPAKPREYLTITHKAVNTFGMCDARSKVFKKTFPLSEFGARGIPVTLDNAVRMLEAHLPASWVLTRFTGDNWYENVAKHAYAREAGYDYTKNRRRTKRQNAAIFVRLLTAHANEHVRRITAPGRKVNSLKGATLVKAA